MEQSNNEINDFDNGLKVAVGQEEDVSSQNMEHAKSLLLKPNYKRVPSISRVTVRRMDNQLIIIENPEVYKCNGTYMVFGNPLIDNFGQKLVIAQHQARQPALLPSFEGESDELTIDQKAIDMIIKQTKCTKDEAINALQLNQGDVVNSIFQLCKDKVLM